MNDLDRGIAVVVIGRNEGERLKVCLRSVLAETRSVVYVDSGSSDGSPQYAAQAGCRVVQLEPSQPFTAARARNAGFACFMEHTPDVALVQFIDGDCSLAQGWLGQGAAVLGSRKDVGIACGHVRERNPQETIYNRLYDLEWRQTPGEIRSTGGIFMVRAEVFRAAGGFRADVIAAEDDEFCVRVRGSGYKILHVDVEMVRHDIAITRFSQWWRRSRRTGHAFAQVAALHGRGHEQYFVHDCRRIWLWALCLPVLAIILAPFTHSLSLLALLCAYGLQFAKIAHSSVKRGWRRRDAAVFAAFSILFKFPALLGMLEYHWRRWRGRGFAIIEYKRS